MKRRMYRDDKDILRYKQLPAKRWKPGVEVVWNKTDGLCTIEVPAVIVEYRGKWVVIEAADGSHRVRPHNTERPQPWPWNWKDDQETY